MDAASVEKPKLYRMKHRQPTEQGEPLLIADTQAASRALSQQHPQRIVHGVDGSGQRSYLDGQPIRNGTSVEISLDGTWIPARVETSSIRLGRDDPTSVAEHVYVPVIYVQGSTAPAMIPGCGLPVRRAGVH